MTTFYSPTWSPRSVVAATALNADLQQSPGTHFSEFASCDLQHEIVSSRSIWHVSQIKTKAQTRESFVGLAKLLAICERQPFVKHDAATICHLRVANSFFFVWLWQQIQHSLTLSVPFKLPLNPSLTQAKSRYSAAYSGLISTYNIPAQAKLQRLPNWLYR